MTITYNSGSRTFSLAHSGDIRVVDSSTLQRLAKQNEWGDIEDTMNTSIKFPGKAITVDNRPRVRHALGFRRVGA